jgi:hypothetical protein
MVEMDHVINLCHTDTKPDLFLLYPIACMLLHELRLILLELRYLHLIQTPCSTCAVFVTVHCIC